MSRIKRQGLDYFPLDINFMMSRPVRRVQKSAGDAAVTVLMYIYTSLYGGEGYYLAADGDYLEYLADLLYGADTGFVERVIREAVKQGLFDERVYREHGVLTSREVQKQYLFCTRRRHSVRLDPRYSLLPPDEASPGEAGAGTCAEAPGMPAETPENARSTGKNAQSTAQHSKPLPQLFPRKRGNACRGPDGRGGGGSPCRGREKPRGRPPHLDDGRRAPPATAPRRAEAQLQRPAAEPQPVQRPAAGAVCAGAEKRVRADWPSGVARVRAAEVQPGQNPRAGQVPAEPVPVARGDKIHGLFNGFARMVSKTKTYALYLQRN